VEGCYEYGSPNDSAHAEVAIIRANESGGGCDPVRRPGTGREGTVYSETLEELPRRD
jgi:hypothetical protein